MCYILYHFSRLNKRNRATARGGPVPLIQLSTGHQSCLVRPFTCAVAVHIEIACLGTCVVILRCRAGSGGYVIDCTGGGGRLL